MMTDEDPVTEASVEECPEPDEQDRILQSLDADTQAEEGAEYYLIATRWYNAWRSYVAGTGPHPGMINNRSIITFGTKDLGFSMPYKPALADEMTEPDDFITVPAPVWQRWLSWYDGGPELMRPMYLEGPKGGLQKLTVDVRGVKLLVQYKGRQSELLVGMTADWNHVQASCTLAMTHVMGLGEVPLGLDLYPIPQSTDPPEPICEDDLVPLYRIFAKYGRFTTVSLGPPQAAPKPIKAPSSENSGEETEDNVQVRSTGFLANIKNSISRVAAPSAFMNRPLAGPQDTVTSSPGRAPGLAGLGNLGNTCFMNSSLQCLSHTVPLLKVFLDDAYKSDINKDNPLGCKGELAEAFGALLKKQWQGGVSVVTPRAFKSKLGSFAPQFAGYQQQDSQELLAFLLDGLHEDLNRILKKPYIEEKDADGRPDDEVAKEAWNNYRARNDSVVVDHFQGLLKSTLVCPQCYNRSIKFDPYMYLSLPLPTAKTRVVRYVVMRLDGSEVPRLCAVQVPKSGDVGDLYAAIAKQLHLKSPPTDSLLLAELDLYNSVTVLDDSAKPLSEIRDPHRSTEPHVVAYNFAGVELGPNSPSACEVHVFSRRTKSQGPYASPLSAPLVMYLQEEDLRAMQTHKVGSGMYSNEYIVKEAGVLGDMVAAALRPFKRQKLSPEGDSAMETSQEGVAPNCSMAAAEDNEDNKENEDGNTPPGTHRSGAASGRVSGVGEAMDIENVSTRPLIAGGAAKSSALGLTERDISLSSSHAAAVLAHHQQGSKRSAEDDSSSYGVGRGGSYRGMGSPTSSLPEEPQEVSSARVSPDKDDPEGPEEPGSPVQGPFGQMNGHMDMFKPSGFASAGARLGHNSRAEGQHGTGGASYSPAWDTRSPAASDGGAEGAPEGEQEAGPSAEDFEGEYYTIKRSTERGEVRLWSEFSGDYSKPVCFAVEWQEKGADEYDLEAMRNPARDASADLEQEDPLSKGVSLDQCLQAFTTSEQLDETDSWYCSKCKAHVRADKKLDLWTVPEVLVVHLKRFSYSRLWRDKLDTMVDFPLEGLDLSPYLLHKPADGAEPVYDLFAVSNHYGSLGGGHYTAYCRMPDTGSWHTFDDSHVSSVNESTVQSTAAYVLFYRRRDQHIKEQGLRLQAVRDPEEAAAGSEDAGPSSEGPPSGAPILLGYDPSGTPGSREHDADDMDAVDGAKGPCAAEMVHLSDGLAADLKRSAAAAGDSSSSSAEDTPPKALSFSDVKRAGHTKTHFEVKPAERVERHRQERLAMADAKPAVVEGFWPAPKLRGNDERDEAMDVSYGPQGAVTSSSGDEPMS